MRILWLKADKLPPLRSGGNICTRYVLRYTASQRDWPAIGERFMDVLHSAVENLFVWASEPSASQA